MTKLTTKEIGALKALYNAGSSGEWRVDQGMLSGGPLWITNWWRERRDDDGDCEGPIASVATSRMVAKKGLDKSSRSYRDVPHKNARADADLIVGAVNALPKLIDALAVKGVLDEAAWLVEFTADRHAPTRYWAAAHDLPVLDVNEATRLCRREDAEAIIKAYGFERKAKAVEHAWNMSRLEPADPA